MTFELQSLLEALVFCIARLPLTVRRLAILGSVATRP